MARALYTGSDIQACDTNGDPAPGAKLYAYLTATTTPTTMYVADTGIATHANPLVADSAGRFPDVFLDVDITYRMVLTNSAGSDTIYDLDPVKAGVGTGYATYAVLAATGGAALIGSAAGDTLQDIIDGLFYGLFEDFAATPPAIPLACLRIQTQGHAAVGMGAAWYNYDGTVNSTYVTANPRISFLDSLGRGWKLDLTQPLTFQMFGAVMDGGTDDLVPINEAIAYLNAEGGGTIRGLAGTYYHSDEIEMATNVRIVGEGPNATIFESDHAGDGMAMRSTINSSTAVNTHVENLQIYNTNGSNTGGGYVDVAGTFVNLFNVEVRGFKYSVIFDQTELATIRQGNFDNPLTGGIWLVNGNDHTSGGNAGFTNRINIEECQFNSSGGIAIINDGGYVHCIRNCNFNGWVNHIRAAGFNGLEIACNEFESATGENIVFAATSYNGGDAVGAGLSVKVDSNAIIPTAGQSCIDCTTAVGPLVVVNNLLGNSAAAKITGLSNVATFIEFGNEVAGGTFLSGTPTNQFRDKDAGTFTPALAFGGGSTGLTYGSRVGLYRRVGNVVHYAISIVLSAKGSSAGAATISGLPYTSNSTLTQGVSVQRITGLVTATACSGTIASSATTISLNNGPAPSDSLYDTNVSDTTEIQITGTYFV